RWIAAPWDTPVSCCRASAARSTRLSSFDRSSPAKGPETVSDKVSAGSAVSRSPSMQKAKIVSIAWRPSGNSARTCSARLIFDGVGHLAPLELRPAERIGYRGVLGRKLARLADHRLGGVDVLAPFELRIAEEIEQQRLFRRDRQPLLERGASFGPTLGFFQRARLQQQQRPQLVLQALRLGERNRAPLSIGRLRVALHRME